MLGRTSKWDMHMSVRRAAVHSIFVLAPITVGTSIYLLWRPLSLRVFTWADYVGLTGLIVSARSQLARNPVQIPDFLVYSLPTGLWSFSFIYCVTVIWSGSLRQGRIYFGIAISMIFGAELLQLLYLDGVFDPMDMWANSLGVVAGFGAARIVGVR